MIEFAYNNAKYASKRYIPFKLNCRYQPRVSYEKNIDPYSRSKAVDELTEKLRNLMAAFRENLQYAQKLRKQAYNKKTKPRSYALYKKVWLNSKYIKPNAIRSWRRSFLGFFEFCTQWIVKLTNSNCQNDRGSMTFSTCLC